MKTINQLLMKYDVEGAYYVRKLGDKLSVYIEPPFKTLTTIGHSKNCTYDIYLSRGEFILFDVDFGFNFERMAKNIESVIGCGYVADITSRDNRGVISVKRVSKGDEFSNNHELKGGKKLISFELKISDEEFIKDLTRKNNHQDS